MSVLRVKHATSRLTLWRQRDLPRWTESVFTETAGKYPPSRWLLSSLDCSLQLERWQWNVCPKFRARCRAVGARAVTLLAESCRRPSDWRLICNQVDDAAPNPAEFGRIASGP